MAKRLFLIPGVDKRLLIKDSLKAMPDLTRRRFLTGGASLGALTLLTGCDVVSWSLRPVAREYPSELFMIFGGDSEEIGDDQSGEWSCVVFQELARTA